jgi:hypothetical protein
MSKLWERVLLNLRMKKRCIDIGPEMPPFLLTALEICTSEKAFKVAPLQASQCRIMDPKHVNTILIT